MNQQQKELPEQFARLMDSLNRLMLFAAILGVYFFLTPILYRIEKATTTTATSVEKLEKDVTELRAIAVELIRKKMGNDEAWEKTTELLKNSSTQ